MTKMMFKRVKRSEFFALEAKVRSMETQIEEAKNFIKEIEQGNLSIELKNNEGDDADSLAAYLQSMRTQMQKRRSFLGRNRSLCCAKISSYHNNSGISTHILHHY
jgi:hypothetical protein